MSWKGNTAKKKKKKKKKISGWREIISEGNPDLQEWMKASKMAISVLFEWLQKHGYL